MEDRRWSISVNSIYIVCSMLPVCKFTEVHSAGNLYDLLDHSYYSNFQSDKHGLNSGLSTFAFCYFGRDCPVHCRMLSNISGLYPIDAGSIHHPLNSDLISKNVFRLYQVPQVTAGWQELGRERVVSACAQNLPQLRTTVLN